MSTARIPFSASDEAAIMSLGQWMLVVAIIHFIIGGVVLLFSCFACIGVAQMLSGGLPGIIGAVRGVVGVLSGPVLVGQGVLALQAKKAFDAVVATDTADQALLGEAFAKVRIFFAIEVAYGVITLLLGCLDSVTPVALRFM